MKKTKIKKEYGITLVALIITIIILVILAGISILAVYKAKIVEYSINSTQDYLYESIQENAIMNGTESVLDSAVDKIKSIIAGEKEPIKKDPIIFESPKVTETKTKSVTINIKAISENGQKIKYKLYVGTTKDNMKEEVTLNEVESGEEIALTARELTPNTTYYYKIEIITEDNNTVSTEISSFKTKELSTFKADINIPQAEYYKYNSPIEARIVYKTEIPIEESTIIKDKTIRINNKNGANAQIEKIENYEKESLVTIKVGNVAGEFTLEVMSGIENKDGDTIEPQKSKELIIGTKKQRMVSSMTTTPRHYQSYSADLSIDDDLETALTLPAYSGTVEFLFKKSEHIKNITLWHWSQPAGERIVTIYGLKNGQWLSIGKQTDSVPYALKEYKVPVIEGDYTGIKFELTFSKSWVNLYEIMFE